MKRLKGPELRLSDLKVPAVLEDLYWDLRDRRLLPLVGLLIVAIIAVPFLLTGGGDSAPPLPAPHPLSAGTESASLSVAPAEPGLREPSKRLAGRASKNPFKQHYTGPVFKEGAAPVAETSTSGAEPSSVEVPTETSSGGGSSEVPASAPSPAPTPVPAEPSSPGTASPGNGAAAGNGAAQPGEIQLYSFAIDIRVAHTEVTKSGATKMGEPSTPREVKPATALPGQKTPVLTYLGVTDNATKALMLVSLEATSLSGDNKCVSGTSSCQLIALEEKTPEVVEYGEGGTRYKFELLSIEPVKGAKIEVPHE